MNDRKQVEQRMSLYYRNLKRIGIGVIVVSLGNLIWELLVRRYLAESGSPYLSFIPLPWGIWAKNMIGAASGFAALFFYLKKRLYTFGTLLLAFLCAAEVAVIMLSMMGSAGRRTNGIFDITMLAMILLTYTISQTGRDLKHWNRIQSRPASILDLRLKDPKDFFDPVQVSPKMAINREYASTIRRYISALRVPAPLQINLLCSEPVAENVRDMMREVLRMHYEEEEDSIVKVLESRYRRIMSLVIVSVFVIGIIRQTSVISEEMVSAIRALSLEENMDDFFDMDEIIRFFAAHNVLLNFDSYTGSQLSNLKLHEQDGRLSLIPWDYNLAFGTFPSVIGFEHWEDPTRLLNLGVDTPLLGTEEDFRPLWKVIRSHPEYLAIYHEVLRALLGDHLLSGKYEAEIDRGREMLLPWIEKDPTAFCTADEFQAACETMKVFLAIRTESIRRQLAGELSTVSEEQETQAMVDASGLDLQSLGALVVGK